MNNKLVEELADLEHRQWMEWALNLMSKEKLSDSRTDRWIKFLVPYNCLSEEYKDMDRVWAKQVLEILSRHAKVEEPPAINGLGVTVCPECGTAIKHCEGCPPIPVKDMELLEELAKRKGLELFASIELQSEDKHIDIDGDDLQDAEAKARAYLEGLEDKGGR